MKYSKGESDFLKLAQILKKDKKYLELAKELELKGQKRVILDRESKEPYLIRYYVQNFRPFCRVVLHNVLRSDIDGLHDHPWSAETFILSGGYWETKLVDNSNPALGVEKVWRPAGHNGSFSAQYFHRLELDAEKAGEDTWTLFMMGAQEKDWGFLDENNEWVQHEEYIKRRAEKLRNGK